MAGFEKQSLFCIQIIWIFSAEQPSRHYTLQWLSTSEYENCSTYLRCNRAQSDYTEENLLLLLGTKNVFWTDKDHRGIITTCMEWQAKDFQKQNTDCIFLAQFIIRGCLHPIINKRLLKEMKCRSTSLLNVNSPWNCWI